MLPAIRAHLVALMKVSLALADLEAGLLRVPGHAGQDSEPMADVFRDYDGHGSGVKADDFAA